jgi:hypothetical protein
MDFRFIAAGILAGTVGFVGGSTMFADASQPSDPTIAGLAAERQAADAAAAEMPPAAKLPALPKAPKIPVVPPAVAPRVVVVRVRSTRTANRTVTAKPKPVAKHESEQHHEDAHEDDHGDDHGGDD